MILNPDFKEFVKLLEDDEKQLALCESSLSHNRTHPEINSQRISDTALVYQKYSYWYQTGIFSATLYKSVESNTQLCTIEDKKIRFTCQTFWCFIVFSK